MTGKSWKKIWNENAKKIKPKNLNDLLKLNGHSSATSKLIENGKNIQIISLKNIILNKIILFWKLVAVVAFYIYFPKKG